MSQTFFFTVYRQTSTGLQECRMELDGLMRVVSETTKSVQQPSARDVYPKLTDVLLNGTKVARQAVEDEAKALQAKLGQSRTVEGRTQFTLSPEAVVALQLLTQNPNPCVSDECKRIRAACDAEIEASGGDQCESCSRGAILRKYQAQLVDAKITK